MLNSYTHTATSIRIVIADDHTIFRSGLATMLEQHTLMQIVGEASNGKELVEIVAESKPNVVMTDIRMPILNGLEATKTIRKHHPDTGVIALTMFDQEGMVTAMVQAGAKGYLLKNTTKEEVVHAVQVVNTKGTYYCSTASNKMVSLMGQTGFHPYEHGKRPRFCERDIQIIRLLCKQYNSKAIGEVLNISSRAVEGVRERIQEKMGAHNVAGIVVYAIKHGIFSID